MSCKTIKIYENEDVHNVRNKVSLTNCTRQVCKLIGGGLNIQRYNMEPEYSFYGGPFSIDH